MSRNVLTTFPNEIFHHIANLLSISDLNSFAKSMRLTASILIPTLYERCLSEDGGFGALAWAARTGNVIVARLFLGNYGVSANIKEAESGMTPLHYAALYGHSAVTEVLLEFGADVSIECNRHIFELPRPYWCPFDVPDLIGHWCMPQRMFKNVYGFRGGQPLHFAAYSGSVGMATLLLGKGANPNASVGMLFDEVSTLRSWTVQSLHIASLYGLVPFLRLLLDNGVDVESENDSMGEREARRALHLAIRVGKWETAKFLRLRGVRFFFSDSFDSSMELGRSTLCTCCTIEKLLETIDGESLELQLLSLIRAGRPEAVPILVKAGAHINSLLYKETSPLAEAASYGFPYLVQYLLRQGAKIGWTGSSCNNSVLYQAIDGWLVGEMKSLGREIISEEAIQRLGYEGRKAFEMLLEAGADVESVFKQAEDPNSPRGGLVRHVLEDVLAKIRYSEAKFLRMYYALWYATCCGNCWACRDSFLY